MSHIEKLAAYSKIEISVECGERVGSVFTFVRQDRITSDLDLIEAYKAELKRRLEEQKFRDGYYIFHCDPGPTIATANFFEFGGYEQLIQLLCKKNSKKSLKGLECVLEVVENGSTHHMMLKKDEQHFYNTEQLALIKYSLIRQCEINGDRTEGTCAWIRDNAEKFENLVKSTRVNMVEGSSYIYQRCAIYKDLFKTIKQAFEIDEQKISEYEVEQKLAQLRYR